MNTLIINTHACRQTIQTLHIAVIRQKLNRYSYCFALFFLTVTWSECFEKQLKREVIFFYPKRNVSTQNCQLMCGALFWHLCFILSGGHTHYRLSVWHVRRGVRQNTRWWVYRLAPVGENGARRKSKEKWPEVISRDISTFIQVFHCFWQGFFYLFHHPSFSSRDTLSMTCIWHPSIWQIFSTNFAHADNVMQH